MTGERFIWVYSNEDSKTSHSESLENNTIINLMNLNKNHVRERST